MSVFILDTNIVSYCLKQDEKLLDHIDEIMAKGHEILIAPFAYYEIKRGLLAIKSKNRINDFNNFCEMISIGEFDNRMLDTAAEIYVSLRQI